LGNFNLSGSLVLNNGANLTSDTRNSLVVSAFSVTTCPTCSAYGAGSFAHGRNSTASGIASYAGGNTVFALASCSHAEGFDTHAEGKHSHAEGWNTVASGEQSHAEGFNSIASGKSSHAEGDYARASGNESHAEGAGTQAMGARSHAAGTLSVAVQDRTWIWSSVGSPVSTTNTDQFMVCALNGAVIGRNLLVDGVLTTTDGVCAIGNTIGMYASSPSNYMGSISSNGVTTIISAYPDFSKPAIYSNGNAVTYAINELGDIFLVGRLPLPAVTDVEIDRILGAVLQYSDSSFNPLLELGFASSIRREWAWRVSRGESLSNLKAFEHLI
jgi:hypothetical protein